MCENFRYGISAGGASKRFESVDGNTLVVNPYLPIGTNIRIGSLEDDGQQVIFNLNYNSTGNGIYAFLQGVWYIVLLDSQVSGGLGLDPHHNINGIALIGNLLFWTDNLNQPRRINYIAGIKMNHVGFVTTVAAYAAPLSQENITIVRRPPIYPLSIQKVTTAQPFSQIKGSAFYFFYSYVYRDFEVSKWSERSVLAPYSAKTDTFDTIRIKMPLGELVPTDAQKVQFGMIYAGGGTAFIIRSFDRGNFTDAAAIAQHNAGTAQLSYDFYGTAIGAAIDSADIAAYNDAVPNTSGALGIAENRLFLGNNTIGYDTPTVSSLALSINTGTAVAGQYIFKTAAPYLGSICFYDAFNRQTGAVRTVANAFTPISDYSNNIPKVLSIGWALSNTNALAEIPNDAKSYSVLLSNNGRTRFFVQSRAANITYTKIDGALMYVLDGSISNYSSECYGIAVKATYLFSYGLGYTYQQGDVCIVWAGATASPVSLTVKDTVGDWIIIEPQDLGVLDSTIKVLFEIYSPLKTDDTNNYYERAQRFPVTNAGTTSRSYSTLSGTFNGDVYLQNRPAQNVIHYNTNVNNINATYHTIAAQFVSEDIADANYAYGSSTLNAENSFDVTTDDSRWIFRTFANPETITVAGLISVMASHDNTYFARITTSANIDTMLTAKTALSTNVTTTFSIYQDVQVPPNTKVFIRGVMSDGSAIYYQSNQLQVRVNSNNVRYIAESMSANDTYWKNWYTDGGRLQIVSPLGRSVKKTGLRFSDTVIIGSQQNGLSSFSSLNEKDLPLSLVSIQKLGVLNKAEEEGNVLVAVGEKDTVSIYLGEQRITSNSGGTAFLAADGSVIGTVNELRGGYGTQFPESFAIHKGNGYWVDNINCTPVQYSANGLYAMADAGARIFWKQFFSVFNGLSVAAIEALGNRPYLYGGIAPYYNEYVISIPKTLATPPNGYLVDYGSSRPYPYAQYDGLGKTMNYLTESQPNSWRRADTYVAEGFAQLGNTLYAFKGGQLYRHGSGNASFFGVQQACRIALVFNDDFSSIKVLNGLALEGCNVAPTFTHIRTEVPNVQSSDLVAADYKPSEGVLYADLLLDRLTPSAPYYDAGQFGGDKMMGQYALVLLEFDAAQSPTLTAIDIFFEPSLGHTT